MSISMDAFQVIHKIERWYPRLCAGVALHVTPTLGMVKYRDWSSAFKGDTYSALRGMDVVNSAGSRLLSLCNGALNVKEIIQRVYPEADLQEILRPLLGFFLQAQQKGHVELCEEMSEPSKLPITGSFEFYVPFHISVELTSQCNLRCTYCYNQFSNLDQELTAAELIAIFEQWRKLGLMGVELTGGEPLIKRGFWEIFQYCGEHFEIIGLLTNGTLINEHTAKLLSRYAGKLVVGVSLDGSCPDVHEKLRGRGSFGPTTKGIKLLVEAGLKVRVGMTVTPDNIFDLENTVRLAKDLGAKFFSWSPVVAFGRGAEVAWKWDPSQAKAIYDLEQKVIQKYRGFITVVSKEIGENLRKLGNCGLGYKNVAISPSGKIRPCLFLREQDCIGDLRKNSLEEVLRNPLMQFFRDLKMPGEEYCRGCKYEHSCSGCIVKPLTFIEKEGRVCTWANAQGIADWLTQYQKYAFRPEQPLFTSDE